MKNILILAGFLFIASFSFVGCDGEDGTNGAAGITGPSFTEELGLTGGQHVDLGDDGIVRICDDGYHAHPDPDGYHSHSDYDDDGVCRDADGFDQGTPPRNADGFDEDGHNIFGGHDNAYNCTHPAHWNLDPNGDGDSSDASCAL